MKPRKISVNLSENWVGQRFGKLVIRGFGYNEVKQNHTWKCECDCGNVVEVIPGNLKSGRVRSCGCAQLESATKHGQRYTRLYSIWVGMRRRCRDIHHPTYTYYGAREIRVCPEWEDYATFSKWAFGNGYSDELSIDRINVNGNYEPANCRWATSKEQSLNRRSTRYVTVFGETLNITKAVEKYGKGLSTNTVLKRIDTYGMSAEQALVKISQNS